QLELIRNGTDVVERAWRRERHAKPRDPWLLGRAQNAKPNTVLSRGHVVAPFVEVGGSAGFRRVNQRAGTRRIVRASGELSYGYESPLRGRGRLQWRWILGLGCGQRVLRQRLGAFGQRGRELPGGAELRGGERSSVRCGGRFQWR